MKVLDFDEMLFEMNWELGKAAESDNSLDQTTYYGHRAICVGLVGIATELRAIREQLKVNAQKS